MAMLCIIIDFEHNSKLQAMLSIVCQCRLEYWEASNSLQLMVWQLNP